MAVSIIGTRGCGKSTFIGLLYQAMERYSNENPNEFIYYVTAETGEKIYDIRNNMLSGEYPAATTRNQLEQLKFLLGFRPKPHEQVVNTFKNFARFGKYGNFLGMILSVYDISGEDVEEYRHNKSINKEIKQVFDADILVIIIDTSKFTNSTLGRKYRKMLYYDKELAIILSSYVEYRNKTKINEKLHPIFIFAKIDALDAEIREEHEIESLSEKYEGKKCEKIGNNLMRSYLSASRAAIYGAQKVGVPLAKAVYFYSWVEEEKVDGVPMVGAQHRLKVIKPLGKIEHARNVYPEHMYEAFINHTRELSYLYADPEKQVEEIFGKMNKNKV